MDLIDRLVRIPNEIMCDEILVEVRAKKIAKPGKDAEHLAFVKKIPIWGMLDI